MKKPDYVYVSYIATTPEKLWQALMDTDLMAQWWVDPLAGCARMNVSDWKPGSRWTHTRADGSGTVDMEGKVVECTPPKRLVYTWARPDEAADASKHSRVSFDIEPYSDGLVRLTVAHDELELTPRCWPAYRAAGPRCCPTSRRFWRPGMRCRRRRHRDTLERGASRCTRRRME